MTHAISIKQAAKHLGMGSNTLFKTLRERGVLHGTGGLKNTPRLEYIKKFYFRVQFSEYCTGQVKHQHIKTLVTPTGLAFIAELLQCDGNVKTNTTSKAMPVISCAPCE